MISEWYMSYEKVVWTKKSHFFTICISQDLVPFSPSALHCEFRVHLFAHEMVTQQRKRDSHIVKERLKKETEKHLTSNKPKDRQADEQKS